jgi:hypothetical protein
LAAATAGIASISGKVRLSPGVLGYFLVTILLPEKN